MINTVIIEDEKPAARLLQRKLDKIGIEATVMLHSVHEAIQWFSANPHPDLIFLDIQLSDGLSFEIFENIQVSSAVIFTTAYDEYALKAFKLNSIDYLLKPIDEDDLERAVDKFKARFAKPASAGLDFEEIRRLLVNPVAPSYKQRFTVKIGQHLKVIPIAEIECFYSENKGTYLHTVDNRDYLLETTLEVLEGELDPAQFFRVSRKFIVSLHASRDIVMYSNSRLKINLPAYKGEEVIVSREKVSDFRQWLS